MQMRAQRGTNGTPTKSMGGLLMVLVGIFGCKAERAPEPPHNTAPRAPEERLAKMGRIFPNLVLIYDPGKQENELWVRLEIDLNRLTTVGPDSIASLLRIGTPDALDKLEKLVDTIQGDNGKPSRQAFKEMIHCAFEDNKLQVDEKPSKSCPDQW